MHNLQGFRSFQQIKNKVCVWQCINWLRATKNVSLKNRHAKISIPQLLLHDKNLIVQAQHKYIGTLTRLHFQEKVIVS